MRFGIFFEHQLPRPWNPGDELELFQNALDQCEFADKIGLLSRLDENGRVRLLLDIMGGEVLVDVARANLLPAVE